MEPANTKPGLWNLACTSTVTKAALLLPTLSLQKLLSCKSSHKYSHSGLDQSLLLGHGLLDLVQAKQVFLHATAIPSRTYPFSSDQGSQTGLGSTSTRLSDRPGTLSAVVSFLAHRAVLLPIPQPIPLLQGHHSSDAKTQAKWPHLHRVQVSGHSAAH